MTGFGLSPFGASPFGGGNALATYPNATQNRNYVEWLIHPREKNLARIQDPVVGWNQLNLVERYLTPDTWMVSGPPSALAIFQPGMGCILQRDDKQVTSGQVTNIQRGSETVNGRAMEKMMVTFASDLAPLGGRIIFPDPAHNLTTSISKFLSSYDLRAGAVETLILGYIRSHIGNLAQLDRRLDRLRIPASLNRGGTTQVSGRLDNLGVLVKDLAEAGNLRVQITHTEDGTGSWLDIVITEVADLSANVRFGTADTMSTGLITDWNYEIGAPTTTRAIVAGGGELADREFLQIDSLPAEALWGMVTETLIDQRQVAPESADKLSELTRAANEALTEGAGPVKVEFTPILGPDLEYRRDVQIGDIVGYDLPGLEPAKDKIREATTVVSVTDNEPTETVSVVVGTPEATASRDQRQIARSLREINIIKRSQ